MLYIYSEIAAITLALIVVYLMMTGAKGQTNTAIKERKGFERSYEEERNMIKLTSSETAETLNQLEATLIEAISQADKLDDALLSYTLSMSLQQVRYMIEQANSFDQQHQLHS
ncbi:hypothetical protein [Cohaesibacter marisflavi]|uniref:hypothetical protein n=1 Tax=Cohaesibacter marisflavi TaxID=655353 RepID=UPI0029C9A800|nr:hypothetical protein [Cohaesibacter marisflavi]